MKNFRTLDESALRGKRVLVRLDLNLPIEKGQVTDTTRIDRALPTLRKLAMEGAKIILLSHFGRPKGKPQLIYSLRQVLPTLVEKWGAPIAFCPDCKGPTVLSHLSALQEGSILLLENTRFYEGEEKNDPAFAAELAALGDFYVNDAFSAAHRAHASTEGIAHFLPSAIGYALQAELTALERAFENPARPLAAIVGGAKISTKLEVLSHLARRVDYLIIGGAMANTFLAAQNKKIGQSLCEYGLLETARQLLKNSTESQIASFLLPCDGVVARYLEPGVPTRVIHSFDEIEEDEMILDIGPQSVQTIQEVLKKTKTLIWNGPLGAFETPPFAAGTQALAHFVAQQTKAGHLVSIAGGGDTVAALNQAGLQDDLTYLSTAGGAFLEWLEGKDLPGIDILSLKKQKA